MFMWRFFGRAPAPFQALSLALLVSKDGGQDRFGGSEGLAQSILLVQVSYRHFNFTEGRGTKFQLLNPNIEPLTISVPKNHGQSFR